MMKDTDGLLAIAGKIADLKKTAMELRELGENFPSLYRNTRRILASVRMLEINVSDFTGEAGPKASS